MNPIVRRIEEIARSQRPAVTALGIIESVDPVKKTATVRYMGDHGQWMVATNAPIAMEPGWWAPGFKRGDTVELHFLGGNPLAPIVTKKVSTDFHLTRIQEWSSPAPTILPEVIDGGNA